MRVRITICNDDTGEVFANHQFCTEQELEAIKDMATLAEFSWDANRFDADSNGPGAEVLELLENIVEAVECEEEPDAETT